MSTAIRRAERRDVVALTRLLGAYFGAIEGEVGLQDAGVAVASFLRAPSRAWVAYVDGKPAGCVAMRPLGRRRCELKHLFVAPRYRGMRLARRLLQAVHRHAARAGYSDVYLDTLESMTTAQALYLREGYALCAPYYQDSVRRIFMRKSLAADAGQTLR